MRTLKSTGKPTRLLVTATTAQLYELRVDGRSDEEICKALNITHSELRRLDTTLLSEQAFQVASEPADRTFARYRIDQRRNIKALDELIEELDGNTQYNAVVGAIRLRADLHDRIIDTGQKLGVIAKAAQRHEHSGMVAHGVLIGKMDNAELRASIKNMMGSTQQMVSRHGDKPFLELKAGEDSDMYYGEPAKEVITVPAERVSDDDERPRLKSKPKKKKTFGRRVHIS